MPFSNSSSLVLTILRSYLTLLRQSDYSKVKHWVCKHGNSFQVSVINGGNVDSMSDDDKNLETSNDLNQKDSDGVLAFLENNNGRLISYNDKRQLYRAMCGF